MQSILYDIQVLPIAAETWGMRSCDSSSQKFEIEYALNKGTTENSYLICADKVALFDPPPEEFNTLFTSELQRKISLDRLDYIILGHIHPSRTETLKALLAAAPQVTLVCSNPGAILLQELLGSQLNILTVKGGESLDLGQGHHLEFIPAPTPRWADGLCTYDPKTLILFTDRFFGAHVCDDQFFDEEWQAYSEDRRYYFDCLMAPQATQVASVLDKLVPKSTQLYATGCGPLVEHGLNEVTRSYRQWVQQQLEKELSVAVIFASAYGNTAAIARALSRGITKAGVAVESINCEAAKPEEIEAAVKNSAGFIIGSPTLGGHAPTQIQTALGIVLASASKDNLVGVFGSYGWSGEAVSLIEKKLKDAGYRFGFEPISVKFKPEPATIKSCEEMGTDFAQQIKRQQKKRSSKSTLSEATSDRVAQAVGRIIGSSCIVTARKGDLESAMLASWVAQATFNPPGITVAVAKERAIESMLVRDDRFVLNILGEGNSLQKHFLKDFAPAENRFAAVETETANNGCPLLKASLAYVECQVKERLECGDHWLVYAIADSGQVLDPQGVTAVHHRQAGDRY